LTLFPYDLLSLHVKLNSSQGPTDDQRIQPDLAVDGTDLYSTYLNGKYAVSSGT